MWFPWRNIARSKPTVSAYLCSTTSSLKDILGDEEPATPQRSTPAVFRRSVSAASALRFCQPLTASPLSYHSTDHNRIVLYHTSLRVVRRTFEDCLTVRSILSSFPVAIDERDLSMDSRFRAELEGIVGKRKKLTLPLVLIDGRYIYNTEEIQRLHETGELNKIVEELLPWVMGSASAAAASNLSNGGAAMRTTIAPKRKAVGPGAAPPATRAALHAARIAPSDQDRRTSNRQIAGINGVLPVY